MTTQPTINTADQFEAAKSATTDPAAGQLLQCLLIVAPERWQRLSAALDVVDVETTWCASLEEVVRVCRRRYDLVVVDVEPEHLVNILKTVREKAGHAEIPVLVECSRLGADPHLAGVLPRYRAMPCNFAELMKLIRWHLRPLASPHQSRHLSARRFL